MPKEMIVTHTLAKEIINRHNDPCPIFDDRSILNLREFVKDPSNAPALLVRLQLKDEDGQDYGSKANAAGDLVAYLMAVHGTEKAGFSEGEITDLRQWFENGGGKTDDE